MSASALRGLRGCHIVLELELQAVVVHLMWVLRPGLRFEALPVTAEPSLQLQGLYF